MTVVAINQQYPGHAKQAGTLASQVSGAAEMNRLTVVVEDHVDITNLRDVVFAILARCDPARGVEIVKRTKGSRIDMAMGPAERELSINSRMIIDATTPYEWKKPPAGRGHHRHAGEVTCHPGALGVDSRIAGHQKQKATESI